MHVIYRMLACFEEVSNGVSFPFLLRASRSCYHRFSLFCCKTNEKPYILAQLGSQNKASFWLSGRLLWGPLWGLSGASLGGSFGGLSGASLGGSSRASLWLICGFWGSSPLWLLWGFSGASAGAHLGPLWGFCGSSCGFSGPSKV